MRVVIFFISVISTFSAFSQTPESILQRLELSEKKIQISRSQFSVRRVNTNRMIWAGEWGYKYPKGYLRGTQSLYPKNQDPYSYNEIYAFDGKKLRTFQPDPQSLSGSVRELGVELDSRITPQTLLGNSIKTEGRFRLSDILRDTEDLEFSTEDLVMIDGNECYYLTCTSTEIIGRSTPNETISPIRVHVWLDANRDLRPLRIETYRGTDDTQLRYRIDNINLEQVGDTWMPVAGTFTFYRKKVTPLNGFTLNSLRKLLPGEVSVNVKIKREPSKLGPQQITISNWEILDDLDNELFTIDFPKGAKIWDDFLQKGYTVGEVKTLSDLESILIDEGQDQTEEVTPIEPSIEVEVSNNELPEKSSGLFPVILLVFGVLGAYYLKSSLSRRDKKSSND